MGVVLYEMLSGDLPFTGDSAVDIAMKQVSDPPPPLHDRNRLVSPAMEQVVMRALAKDPALRFASARQMAEELARVARGQGASSDTQQATRVIAAADATRVIGRPGEGATSVIPPPAPPERPAPKRSALPWLLVLLLLALAAVAGFVVYKMLNGNDLSVPQAVIGQTCKQGLATLKADGLAGKCVNAKSDLAHKGKIVGSDPAPGAGVSKGSLVSLKVGIGPATVQVPSVKGLSLTAATTKLQHAGFVVGSPQPVNSPKAPLNVVIGSTPKEGTAQKPGTTVILKIATGSVKIPSVSGLTCAQATKKLQNITLKPTCQNRASQAAPKGQAFATFPIPVGNLIQQNSPITIFISNGPSQAPLPNVVGDTAGDAKRTLHSAGFQVKVIQVVDCTDPTRDFIVQSQSPNTPTAPRGSLITIMVARYKPNDPTCNAPPGST
jgi:serine/threonine-protein kinase